MNECLTSLVGVEGCASSTAPYKLNQIGLSENQLSQMLDDSYANVDDMVTAMKEFAAQRLVTDLVASISTASSAFTTLETNTIGYFEQNVRTIQGSNNVGVILELRNYSEFLKINVNEISLFLNHAGDVDLKIYDLMQGKLLDTVTVTAVAGEAVAVQTSFEFKSSKQRAILAFVYDSTGVEAYDTYATPGTCISCGGSLWYRGGAYTQFSGVEISGGFFRSNATQRGSTYGVSFEYSINCDNAAWLCTVKQFLGLAMLYKTAEAIFEYSNDSAGQFSEQKVLNDEGNAERYTRAQFNYQQEIKKALRTIKLPDGVCFSCNPTMVVHNTLPG